jgi:hypothetical protein
VSRSWTNLILPALVVVGGVVWCVRSKDAVAPVAAIPPPPSASAPAITSETYPLLEGLKPGDALGEWVVQRIILNQSPQNKPQLAVELERKGSGITIWVARKENAANPPLATERYALSFGHARPYGEPIPGDAYDKSMNLIAERIRRTESKAPVPPGL